MQRIDCGEVSVMRPSGKAEAEAMLQGVDDERLRLHIGKALDYLGDASRRLIVANGIARAREGGYGKLALELARLACRENPGDPGFLLELCNCLDDPQEVIDEITGLTGRVERESVERDKRDRLLVALADAYRRKGMLSEGIDLLEEARPGFVKGVELLAQLYFERGEPRKAIDVVYQWLRHTWRLSEGMRHWLVESLDAAGNHAQALEVLRAYRNDPVVAALYEELQRKLGLVSDSDRVDAVTGARRSGMFPDYIVRGEKGSE